MGRSTVSKVNYDEKIASGLEEHFKRHASLPVKIRYIGNPDHVFSQLTDGGVPTFRWRRTGVVEAPVTATLLKKLAELDVVKRIELSH
ncbi:MAG: hypothetical protein VKJ04_01230 [Vampirovibrionales bacterium]|nr:hypothetical protein [Vampirovibrionales bacterium]